jgi:hypothetical protein
MANLTIFWSLILAAFCAVSVRTDCVWYDQCGDDPDFGDGQHGLNCVYNGPAGKLFDTILFRQKICITKLKQY